MANFKNTIINDTGFIKIPSGSSWERPASSSDGMLRFNTNVSSLEYFGNGYWVNTINGFFIDQVITNGLVLHLDAANPASYPGTGTTWTDLSGNGNNGTLTNGPTFDSANGGSLVFDGVDDNIQLGNASNFISSGQSYITFNTWVKTNVTGVYKKIFVTTPPNVQAISSIYFSIGPAPYNTYLGIITSDANTQALATQVLSTTQYSNLCGTYDGSYIKLYLNGSLIASQPQTGNIINTGIARISGYDNNNETWNGNISIFSIYNRALTEQEIQQNFNATKYRYGL